MKPVSDFYHNTFLAKKVPSEDIFPIFFYFAAEIPQAV